MAEADLSAVSVFIEGAPPGELDDVVNDIKALTVNEPKILQAALPAFQRYNEEQLTTVKLPGSSQSVLVSQYNGLQDGRYFDVESASSWAFDQVTQKASAVQSYTPESPHLDLIKSLHKSLSTHASEHYFDAVYGAFPSDSAVAILLVANRYSPTNYWNGRWRCTYVLTPGKSLTGSIQVDVHYYEDGNVRLTASKDLTFPANAADGSASAAEVMRQIALAERKYQEELNRGFANLNEGAFKSLRRQLPVTRQKVEWEKIGGYRLGQDIGGGRGK